MKRIVAAVIASMLVLTACSGKKSPGGHTDLHESYAALREAQMALSKVGAGELYIKTAVEQIYVHAAGGQDIEHEEKKEDAVYFLNNGSGYEYIQVSKSSLSEVPEGFRQQNGVQTLFHYTEYPGGAVMWQEVTARRGDDVLPEEASPLFHLEDEALLESIAVDAQGEYTVYELSVGEAWFEGAAVQSDKKDYSVDAYRLSYFVDESGLLCRVVAEKEESWIQSDMYDIKQSSSFDIELRGPWQAPDMGYFKSNSTYEKPAFADITEIWREEFINLPETYLFDVRIPKMKSDLPGAEGINKKIQDACRMELTATVTDLENLGSWGDYPWRTVDFAVMQFGEIYQICIFNSEASAWGSGVGRWLYKYYYDKSEGVEISSDDFLAHMGYEPAEIEEIFYRDMLVEEPGAYDDYSYDSISEWYYFDENGVVRFYVTLYG